VKPSWFWTGECNLKNTNLRCFGIGKINGCQSFSVPVSPLCNVQHQLLQNTQQLVVLKLALDTKLHKGLYVCGIHIPKLDYRFQLFQISSFTHCSGFICDKPHHSPEVQREPVADGADFPIRCSYELEHYAALCSGKQLIGTMRIKQRTDIMLPNVFSWKMLANLIFPIENNSVEHTGGSKKFAIIVRFLNLTNFFSRWS